MNATLEECGKKEFALNGEEEELLSSFTELLGLFEEATDYSQAEKTVTISNVIPTIHILERGLESLSSQNSAAIAATRQALLNSLAKRFEFLKKSDVHIVSTLVDPEEKISFTNTNSDSFFSTEMYASVH
jgi:hypothetical protein